MIDIISKRYWFFLVSGLLIVLSIVFLAAYGLKPGIEFSAGTELTLNFTKPPDVTALKGELTTQGYGNAIIQTTTTGDYLIRTATLTDQAKGQLEAASPASLSLGLATSNKQQAASDKQEVRNKK